MLGETMERIAASALVLQVCKQPPRGRMVVQPRAVRTASQGWTTQNGSLGLPNNIAQSPCCRARALGVTIRSAVRRGLRVNESWLVPEKQNTSSVGGISS